MEAFTPARTCARVLTAALSVTAPKWEQNTRPLAGSGENPADALCVEDDSAAQVHLPAAGEKPGRAEPGRRIPPAPPGRCRLTAVTARESVVAWRRQGRRDAAPLIVVLGLHQIVHFTRVHVPVRQSYLSQVV